MILYNLIKKRPRVIPSNIARVIIGWGQSNFEGKGLHSEIGDEYKGPFTNFKIYNRSLYGAYNVGSWQNLTLSNNLAASSIYFGPEMSLAKRLGELYPEETFYLIKGSKGGTQIYPVRGNYEWSASSPELLKILLDFWVKPALDKLILEGKIPYIQAILGTQGEADAFIEDSYLTYKTEWNAMMDKMRQGLGVSNVHHIFGTIGAAPNLPSHPYRDQIRAIHAEIDSEQSTSHLINLDAYSRSDLVHLDSAGQIAQGELMAEKIYEIGGYGEPYNYTPVYTFPFTADHSFDFETDALDSCPSYVEEWAGNWEVKNHATLGKSLTAIDETGGLHPNGYSCAIARFTDVPTTTQDMEIRCRLRMDNLTMGRFGLIVRLKEGTSNPTGYCFLVNPGIKQIAINMFTDGGFAAATNAYSMPSMAANTTYHFKIRVIDVMTFVWISTDGGGTWTEILANFTGSSTEGSAGIISGFSGGCTGVYFDDIQIDILD